MFVDKRFYIDFVTNQFILVCTKNIFQMLNAEEIEEYVTEIEKEKEEEAEKKKQKK